MFEGEKQKSLASEKKNSQRPLNKICDNDWSEMLREEGGGQIWAQMKIVIGGERRNKIRKLK